MSAAVLESASTTALRTRHKRNSDDLFVQPDDAAFAAVLLNMSEPKKLKLDPLAMLGLAQPAAPQPASQSASAAAAVAAAALLSFNASAAGALRAATPAPDPAGNPFSKVVHLRNIPSDMSELELIYFCRPFGRLRNYLMLKGKNQAFVEYDEDHGASLIVSIAHAYPMAIRGKTIFCQYSTHQELKTERKLPTNGTAVLGDPAMAQSNLLILGASNTSGAPPAAAPAHNGAARPAGAATPGSVSASQLDISTGTQQQPNSVLRVIVDNMIYPVTLDILYTIFSRYGKVLRIITFSKNHTFQALIQFSEATAAQNARAGLDGQQVYNGCCVLRIDYSKLATLNVKYNNDKSRDYTNPLLPAGELSFEQQLTLAQNSMAMNPLLSLAGGGVAGSLFGAPTAGLAESLQLASQPAGLAPFLGSSSLASLVAASSPAALPGAPLSVAAAQNLLQQQLGGLLAATPVVLVSNLDEKKVTPDALFTLFGVYGDVQRVKILFNKKDNALVQYAEGQQAQWAIQHLDKVRWHDKVIRVASSKHTNVQMPKEGQPDAGLTRDYTNSSLHRFKKPGSKNYLNIYPPSSTLHLSNIPPNITVDFMKKAFEESGFPVKDFQFFQRDHKMALAQMEDVETAIDALIAMHNYKLADNAHLRVSFSKKGLKA